MSAPMASPGRGGRLASNNHLSSSSSRPGPSTHPQAMAFDDGEGDISLSRSGSHSTLASYAALNHSQNRRTGPAPPSSQARRDVTSPVPQRMLQKRWSASRGASAHQQRTASAALPDPTNGDSPSFEPRNSTSTGPSPAPSLSAPTVHSEGAPPNGAGSAPATGRRGITRSHSLNVRIPSVDLSTKDEFKSASSATAVQSPDTWEDDRTNSDSMETEKPLPSPRPPPLVDDKIAAAMSRWVKEVVVCNFDLERGPVVERRAVGRRWGPGEKENVAFSSFPDTSLFNEGSIQFSFKIRELQPNPSSLALPEPPSPVVGTSALPSAEGSKRAKAEEYRAWNERGREWLYGFVWFQQRRDRGIARGYMQKSVVILTHLPFPKLFARVLDHVAPSFFNYGYSALEVACHAFASWPDPTPDTTLTLPLLSNVIEAKLPDKINSPQVAPNIDTILASVPSSTPLRAFAAFLPSLWSLWECLVLAEPVLVIAPDPRTCSEIVWWLRELIRPIPLAGDFRPYLHIHDHDFSLLVNSNKPQPGVVVGVTNPFFRNAASHWPNVISIPGDSRPSPIVARSAKTPTTPSAAQPPKGFISKRHRSISKDRVLLKKLEGLVAAGRLDDPEGNEALRMHFQQLTERFLAPLNRYFQTLVPHRTTKGLTIPSDGSQLMPPPPPALSVSALKPFSLPTFLAHLKAHGPNPLAFKTRGLQSKARVESDFYASFCMSPTFAGWLQQRVESLGIAVANASGASSTIGYQGGSSPGVSPTGMHHLSPVPSSVDMRSSQDTGDDEDAFSTSKLRQSLPNPQDSHHTR